MQEFSIRLRSFSEVQDFIRISTAQPFHVRIGNDRQTDIAGAKLAGMATLYMHTELTPPDQEKADPKLHPLTHKGPHWEYEGDNWQVLADLICQL